MGGPIFSHCQYQILIFFVLNPETIILVLHNSCLFKSFFNLVMVDSKYYYFFLSNIRTFHPIIKELLISVCLKVKSFKHIQYFLFSFYSNNFYLSGQMARTYVTSLRKIDLIVLIS